ncbi:DUF3592 domain-containing protein [Microbulbifer sp. CAU 1566]|uniref:DUF3592 domain-containing protein n=1 Tax=Microbulbifer sp. CAU 1566 TaxID=2933269 RepID=UPI002003AD43|nr:DUF3592 domain-containing protein [Microbulbifer sp. CAU 1566]MCK7598997.1 DUF3592 domain-containing protein [Microbulbifer sp. CAU 1566]
MTVNYFSIVNGAGLFLAAAAFIYFCLVFRRNNWSAAKAKVERSGVDREVDTGFVLTGSDYAPVKKITSVSYTPQLRYRYSVAGREYLGAKLFSVNLLPISTSDLLPIIDGSTVPVFYNPNKPERSYLVAASYRWPVGALVAGVLLAQFNESQYSQLLKALGSLLTAI